MLFMGVVNQSLPLMSSGNRRDVFQHRPTAENTGGFRDECLKPAKDFTARRLVDVGLNKLLGRIQSVERAACREFGHAGIVRARDAGGAVVDDDAVMRAPGSVRDGSDFVCHGAKIHHAREDSREIEYNKRANTRKRVYSELTINRKEINSYLGSPDSRRRIWASSSSAVSAHS